MPAPTTFISGLDWTLGLNGPSPVAAGRDLSVTLTNATIDTTSRDDSNWMRGFAGAREWSASWSGVFQYGGVRRAGNAAIIGIAPDGGASANLAGWTSYGITFSSDTIDIVNATTGLDTNRLGARRTLQFTASGQYYDRDQSTAFATLEIARATSTLVDVVYTIATGFTVAAKCKVDSFAITPSYEDVVGFDYTLTAVGVPTVTRATASQATHIETLTAAFLGATRSNAVVNLTFGPPDVSLASSYADWSFYRGSGIVTEFGIAAEYTGETTINFGIAGTGALAAETVGTP